MFISADHLGCFERCSYYTEIFEEGSDTVVAWLCVLTDEKTYA